jgi:alanine dehydrogenase
VLTANHFAQMKHGAFIVDVAIDQGGSTEWSRQTKPGETYEQGGLIFSCVANIPGSTVPRKATIALTKVTLPYIRLFAHYWASLPSQWLLFEDNHDLRRGLQTWGGYLTNSFVAEKHKLFDHYKPLSYFFQT